MTEMRTSEAFQSRFGSWFSCVPSEAISIANQSDRIEDIRFDAPGGPAARLFFKEATPDALGSLVISELIDETPVIVAVLPVPSRILTTGARPSDIFSRLCARFGDAFQFGGERAKSLIRISATTSGEDLGALPSEPILHEGKTYAPVNISGFLDSSHWQCAVFGIVRVEELQNAVNSPDPWKTGRFEHIELVNVIRSIFGDNLNCIECWGYYLFDASFEGEPELQNKAGSIWLTSLLDSVEGEERALAACRQEITGKMLTHLSVALDQAEAFLETVRELLSLFTRDEQLFIRDFRDQLVHSWLGRRHQKEFRMKFYDGHQISVERFTNAEFAATVRPFYERGMLDETVRSILVRAFDRNLPYWRAIGEIQRDLASFYDAMLIGEEYRIPILSGAQGIGTES